MSHRPLTTQKSGGKPAFPTSNFLTGRDRFPVECSMVNLNLNGCELGVGKVGLPPRFWAPQTEFAPHHQRKIFHQPKPNIVQISMLGIETISPNSHHVRCFTYPAPK